MAGGTSVRELKSMLLSCDTGTRSTERTSSRSRTMWSSARSVVRRPTESRLSLWPGSSLSIARISSCRERRPCPRWRRLCVAGRPGSSGGTKRRVSRIDHIWRIGTGEDVEGLLGGQTKVDHVGLRKPATDDLGGEVGPGWAGVEDDAVGADDDVGCAVHTASLNFGFGVHGTPCFQ
jgi:hypothetical protein